VDPEPDRIDFISAYCDRWYERCAFTLRCSAHAVQLAEGMCGDFRNALELALGVAVPGSEAAPSSASAEWNTEQNADDGPDGELDVEMRRHEARRERAEASPITQLA
jgi:hypothetical protein